jgi:predicted ATPase
MEYTALGDAINIAARMEQTAQPGTIQIAEDTYKQVVRLFKFEPVEGVEIKGKSLPVQVYRVLQRREKPGRRRGIQGLEAPLIGRSKESERLARVLEGVKQGRGQILSLIGEAGLGKSRLLQETRELWESTSLEEHAFGKLSTRWNQVLGISYEASQPYRLIQRAIRNFIGVRTSDTPDRVRTALAETLASTGLEHSNATLSLFETLLGVKEQTNGVQLEGEELKKAIYKEMLTILELLIQQGPTVIAFDDLHWSDLASAEFIIHLFQLADRLPILFVCAFRPDRSSPAWKVKQAAESHYAHRYTEITLAPLSTNDSNILVDRLLAADLPGDVRNIILSKSDGNPFFMEEVIRTLYDNNIVVQDPDGGGWQVGPNIYDITIPDNLQALLTARIDQLEETAKHVLQMASVIGRSFYHQILAIISDATYELDHELNNLQRLGLILEAAREPYLEYVFRQALTQETAYNTILLKHRREFHKRVGDALVQIYADRIDEFASVLGHHFYQARDLRAQKYFKMEGDAAFHLYANQEAITYYSQAIEVAMWADEPDLEQLVDLYVCRGRSYELNSQFVEALANYVEMEKIGKRFNQVSIEMAALVAQAQIHSVPSDEFNLVSGLSILTRAKKMAEAQNDQATLAKIYWIMTNLYRFHSSLEEAQEVGEKAIALARELGLVEQLAYSLTDTAHTYNMNGQVERAKEVSLEAVELWRTLGNQPMLADCLAGLATINTFAGEFDRAYRYSDDAYEISLKIENVWGQSYSRYSIGLVDFERGEVDLAIRHFKQARKDAQSSKFFAGIILTNSFLSIVYSELGNHQLALDTIDGLFKNQPEKTALTRSFFLGAKLLSTVRAGRIVDAENLIEAEKSIIPEMIFFAKQHFYLALCYLSLAKGDYQSTLREAKAFLNTLQSTGVKLLSPELLLLIGKTHLAMGSYEKAEVNLIEARDAAVSIGSRRNLWLIDYNLAHCAAQRGSQAEAASYYAKARDTLSYIFDHISDEALRESFLSRSEVKMVLESQKEEA